MILFGWRKSFESFNKCSQEEDSTPTKAGGQRVVSGFLICTKMTMLIDILDFGSNDETVCEIKIHFLKKFTYFKEEVCTRSYTSLKDHILVLQSAYHTNQAMSGRRIVWIHGILWYSTSLSSMWR